LQGLLSWSEITDENGVRLSNRTSQSGQAVIEYILMMVVAIGIIFGITYQFNDAFRQWGRNYFGDYTSCLLETGELPTIGGTGGVTSACADVFKPFNLADGRQYDGPGGPGGGGGGGGDGDGDGDGGSGNNNNKNSGAGEGGSSAGYSSARRGGGSGFGQDGRMSRGNSGSQGGSTSAKRKAAYTGSTEDSVSGALYGSSRSSSRSRQRVLESGYYIAKDNRTEEQIERAPAKISEGSRTEKTTRMIIRKRVKNTDTVLVDTPMTFGDYFRYLLIAAIIIALIIVVGGQLSSVSSDD